MYTVINHHHYGGLVPFHYCHHLQYNHLKFLLAFPNNLRLDNPDDRAKRRNCTNKTTATPNEQALTRLIHLAPVREPSLLDSIGAIHTRSVRGRLPCRSPPVNETYHNKQTRSFRSARIDAINVYEAVIGN